MRSQDLMIANLQANIDKLLERYEFLQKENQILNDQNFSLQQKNAHLNDEISSYQEELQVLKIAKTIGGSEEYKEDTKAKIDFLVSEIEKCIADLNT